MEDCRRCINRIFDFDEGYIKPEVFTDDSNCMSGADSRSIGLAFSIYSDGAPTAYELEGPAKEEELKRYLLSNMLYGCSSDNFDYVIEAICFRYRN